MTCWGPRVHVDLTRRSVLVVGLGSVGLDVAVRLAAAGMTRLGLMDFDTVKPHNLDRLIGVTAADAWLRRSKIEVACRLVSDNATAAAPIIDCWDLSVCEPAGLTTALDYDQIICCVDRPWPRAVLNALAYRDHIPVIDGGLAVDVFADGDGMRNATWRSHVLRPGRPCMACNGQLDLGEVAADMSGALDDPTYIAGNPSARGTDSANVALISVNAAASLLAQYVSLNVAPGGLGEPGPLQYMLSTHTLEHLDATRRPACPVEALIGHGDLAIRVTGPHPAADHERRRQVRRRRCHDLHAVCAPVTGGPAATVPGSTSPRGAWLHLIRDLDDRVPVAALSPRVDALHNAGPAYRATTGSPRRDPGHYWRGTRRHADPRRPGAARTWVSECHDGVAEPSGRSAGSKVG